MNFLIFKNWLYHCWYKHTYFYRYPLINTLAVKMLPISKEDNNTMCALFFSLISQSLFLFFFWDYIKISFVLPITNLLNLFFFLIIFVLLSPLVNLIQLTTLFWSCAYETFLKAGDFAGILSRYIKAGEFAPKQYLPGRNGNNHPV